MIILIGGTVGVGKSTLSLLLKSELENLGYNVELAEEKIINDIYWDEFYKNPKDWDLLAEISFLISRHKQWLEMISHGEKIYIFDRSIFESFVFVLTNFKLNNLTLEEFEIYNTLFADVISKIKQQPHYFFLLQSDEITITNRLIKRNRKEELKTNSFYWKTLYNLYYDDEEIRKKFENFVKKFFVIDNSKNTIETIEQIIEKLDLEGKNIEWKK